jgi:hypothetical protein
MLSDGTEITGRAGDRVSAAKPDVGPIELVIEIEIEIEIGIDTT